MRAHRRANGIGAKALLGGLILAVTSCTDALGLGDFQVVCTPGAQEPCYSGPAGTEKVGLCHGGSRTCLEDGSGFGACKGEVLPLKEDCSTEQDESCNGPDPNEEDGCLCKPGKNTFCYDGPIEETDGPASACHGGIKECAADGLSYGPCVGEVLPTVETCREADKDKDLNCDGVVGCGGAHDWSQALNGSAQILLNAIAADSAGNLILIGDFAGEMKVGETSLVSAKANSYDAFIVKLRSDGVPAWARNFGSVKPIGSGYHMDVAVDRNDNVLITGTFLEKMEVGDKTVNLVQEGDTDVFVVRLDPTGHFTDIKSYEGRNVGYVNIAASEDGGVVLAAGVTETLVIEDQAFSEHGTVLVRLNSALEKIFAKELISQDGFGVDDMSVGPHGEMVVGGAFHGTLSWADPPLTATQGVFVARLDETMDHIWSSSFGSSGDSTLITGVALGPDNDISTTGKFRGVLDFGAVTFATPDGTSEHHGFAVRVAPNNQVSWAKDLGVSESTGQIFNDAADNVLVSFGDFDPQDATKAFHLFKYAPTGETIWEKSFGLCSSGTYPYNVFSDSRGNVFYAGTAGNCTCNLGGPDLTVGGPGSGGIIVGKFFP